MADLSAYYQAIREQKAELAKEYPEGFIFITSVRNISKGSTAGTVTEVDLTKAARHILEATARISTEKEIADHIQRGENFTAQMNAAEQKRAGARFINLVQGPAK